MKTTAKIMAVFLLVLALGAGNLGAEIIEINITAEIAWLEDFDGLLEGQLSVGDIITGSYTYDSSTPDSAPGPSVGRYLHYSPPYGINLSVVDVEGFVFQTDPNNVEFWVEVGNNNVATTDNYLIRSRNNLPLYDNVHVGIIDWHLDDSTGTALSSTALPTTAPVLEDWDDEWGMRINGGIPDEYGKFMESFLIEAPVISVELVPHQPKAYYVDASDGSDDNDGLSPQTPFATIQKAIDSAFNGDTVIVADGTYTGPGNRDIDFLGKAITVKSESGPENCIIDCNGTETEPHRGFYFHSFEGASSIVNGLTIINGHAPLMQYQAGSHTYNYWAGGAIFCYQSSPTISNCLLINNSADWYGGAIGGWKSDAIITGCIIMNNVANSGGGINCRSGTMIISNCIITSNRADGGVIGLGTNSGGAINCESLVDTMIINCVITKNVASAGSGIFAGGYCRPVIINSTFSGNTATSNGGAIYCSEQSSPYIANCILWGDNATYGPEIAMCPIDWGSSLSVSYSNVQGGEAGIANGSHWNCRLNWGEGNIDEDPYFVEPGYWADADDPNIIVEPDDPNAIWIDGDYHLLPDSPCIDSGDNNSVPADIHDLDGDGNTTEPLPFDLDGNPRFVDRPDIEDTGNGTPPIVDMGAYEAMVSCFGVNHVKLGTKAGKKGDDIKIKGTFNPGVPIDLMINDVMYTIDDGQDHVFSFLIPAGSFELEGKGDKDKYKFHSPKGSVPDIKAKFDFDKCKFELKAKRVQGTDEITNTSLEIILQAGANIAQEIVELEVKGKKGEHLEFKREPKLNCCQM